RQVAIKFFHKNSDEIASARIKTELATCLRVHHGLLSAPILDDGIHQGQPCCPPVFGATALVFDWADGGDAHALMINHGGVGQAQAVGLFRQVLCGLRALHRRGIVHRDIK
ncbi:unnamed protein product, partial [Sphacelaria rigidula]